MKKISSVLILCALLLFLALPTSALEETREGIFYTVENGEVTVQGFNDVGTVMNIPSVIDGYPVRYIADQACRGNQYMTKVVIPDSVVRIGEYAFAECPNLVSVTVGGGCELIGFSSFRDCAALLKVELSEGLKKIDDYAFYGCIMLGKTTLPSSLSEIGVDVFMGCNRLMLDVGDCAVGAEYAEKYSIPTDFTQTTAFTFLMIVIAAAALGLSLFLIKRAFGKKKGTEKA